MRGRLAVLGCLCSAVLAAPGAPNAGAPAALFVSPGGSDAGRCGRTSPCRSFDRAYAVARPGQAVEVAAGSYPPQTIGADRTKTSSADVVFRPAPGAAVSVVRLDVRGSHIEIRGMRFTDYYWRTWPSARDVTFRNDRAPKFTVLGSSDVRVLGGSYGPIANASNEIAPESPTARTVPTGILVDGVTIHDYRRTDPSAHVDCLHTWGVNGFTVRNSVFYDCEAFDILFTLDSIVGSPTNVLIENNFLDCCRSGFYSVYLGDQHGERWSNFLVRNNSADKPIGIGAQNRTVANLRFYGNIAPSFEGCGRPGVVADYSVWYSGKKCGRDDRVAPAGYENAAAHDFHLRQGAAAIDHGDPASFPRRDIDGQRRPRGHGPDAGADER